MFEDVVMHFIKFIENMPEIQQKSTPSKGFPKICKSKTPLYLSPFFKDTARWKMPSNEIQKTIENLTILRICLDKLKRLTCAAVIHALPSALSRTRTKSACL